MILSTQTRNQKSSPQPLIAGIPLESSLRWSTFFQFATFAFFVSWLLLGTIFYLKKHEAMVLIDALSWGILLALCLTILLFFVYPLFRVSERLVLRNQMMRIEKRKRSVWSLDLTQPFFAALLHRDHREDALLILYGEESKEPCFLYGRYRREEVFPPNSIQTSPFHFSLAEEALDRLGARMMPDRTSEHLPTLARMLSTAEGFAQEVLRLPLRQNNSRLSLEHQQVSWQPEQTEPIILGYHSLGIQAFQYSPLPSKPAQLLFSLGPNLQATSPEHRTTLLEPFRILVDWPQTLDLRELPQANRAEFQKAVPFTPIDTVLLLHQLTKKEVSNVPSSLLFSHDTLTDA